ncbi:hypothetical protein HRbin06_00793 [archaeon HR06]|nr:hypothetical protein HRbin06_00793 [archaeon HR06]
MHLKEIVNKMNSKAEIYIFGSVGKYNFNN